MSEKELVVVPLDLFEAHENILQGGTDETSIEWMLNHALRTLLSKGVDLPMKVEEFSKWFNNLFESACITFRFFRMAENGLDIWCVFLNAFKLITGKNVDQLFEELVKAKEWVLNQFDELFPSENDLQGFSENISVLRAGFEVYRKIKHHALLKAGRKLIKYCLAFGLFVRQGLTFENCNYSATEEAYIKEKYHDGLNFAEEVVDSTLFFLERGAQAYALGTWSPFLYNGGTLSEWCDKAFELRSQYKMYEANNNDEVTYEGLVQGLNQTIERGELLVSTVGLDTYSKTTARKLLSELKFLYCELTATNRNQKTRVAPFAELICGNSSVAKTLFTDVLATHFARVMRLPEGEEYTYHRNPGEQHWNGYKPYMHTLIYDDMGASNPRKVMGLDVGISELLPVVNSNSMSANMADLSEKGHCPVKPHHVIVNSNIEDLHADTYYAFPLALRRRMPYIITVTPRYDPERGIDYRDPASPTMVNVSALPELMPGEYPDQWNIHVKHVIAKPGLGNNPPQVGFNDLRDYTSIYDFLAWYNGVIEEHKRMGSKMQRTQANMRDSTWSNNWCSHQLPRVHCNICRHNVLQGPLSRLFAAPGHLQIADDDGSIPDGLHTTDEPPEIDLWGEAEGSSMWSNIASGAYEVVSLTSDYVRMIHAGLMHYTDVASVHVRALVLSFLGKQATRALKEAAQRAWDSMIASYPLRWAMLILPTLGGAFALYKWFVTPGDVPLQGETHEYGKPFAAEKDQQVNPWYDSQLATWVPETAHLTSSWKGKDLDEVRSLIQRNVVCFSFKGESDMGPVMFEEIHALCVGGHVYVTNNHCIPACDVAELYIVHGLDCDKVNHNKRETLGRSDWFRVIEHDLVFFELHLPPKQDITGLFLESPGRLRCEGQYVWRGMEGLVRCGKVTAITQDSRFHRGLNRELAIWRGDYQLTSSGFCGATLIGNTGKGPAILGIHVAGGITREVECTRIDKSIVDRAVAHFGLPIISPNSLHLAKNHAIQALHPKSIYRYMEGKVQVYGSLPLRPTMRSTVEPTVLAPALEARGWVQTHGAPVMKGWQPWRVGIKPILEHSGAIRNDILKQAFEAYMADILRKVPEEELNSLQILEHLEALNGVPGVKYLEGINRSSSMGYPWQCSKRGVLVTLEDERWQDGVTFKQEVWDEISEMIATYESGKMVNPIFVGQLKDEAVEHRKIVICKTRIFFVGSGAWTIVMRKWFLSFVRLFQRYRTAFEGMPGLCAQGPAWGKLYDHLTRHGTDRMFAGDFKAYDKVLEAVLTLYSYRVPFELCKKAGWSEDELRIMWGMAEDASYPVVLANGDLVRFEGSNPSGISVTVIINCIAHSLLMRYVYILANPAHEAETFQDNVTLVTYGDDDVGNVSPAIEWFDHTVIQTQLNLIGISYTMADKTSETRPFVNIEEVEFLKRKWVWNEEVQDYFAPLNESSIKKRLMIGVRGVDSPEWQSIKNIQDSMEDYFFYGREKFETMKNFLIEVAYASELHDHVAQTEWPQFDDLLQRWREAQSEFSC